MRHESVTTPETMLAPYGDRTPQYTHIGGQRFVPANAAAWREVDRWNAWATRINARSAANRDSVQQ